MFAGASARRSRPPRLFGGHCGERYCRRIPSTDHDSLPFQQLRILNLVFYTLPPMIAPLTELRRNIIGPFEEQRR